MQSTLVFKTHRCTAANLLAVLTTLLLFLWLCSFTATAQQLDLSNPSDAIRASQKIQCSTESGKPVVFWWKGTAYSRVPGERDRVLFNVEGMNIRACQSLNDPQRGAGYRLVSREILLYLDPETNQPLRTWKNPWTGKDVEVIHVANDPVNQPPQFAMMANGKPFKFNATFKNGRFWQGIEVPLFYKNPLGGEYQDYVGGTYHAMEMFNFYGYEKDLLNAAKDGVTDLSVSWHRLSDWLPWMEMGDRPGMFIVVAVGKRVASFEAMSEMMKAEIKKNYPEYTAPPPLDDKRPNETSWTHFKKVMEKKKAKP